MNVARTVSIETEAARESVGTSITCPELAAFVASDPETIWRAFQRVTPMRFRQSWRAAPEEGFLPGTVRVGWRADELLVFAELTDEDIFNDATDHQQQAWKLGDTFEIFVGTPQQRGYFELQVTPNNHRLQLRHRAAPVCRDGDDWALAKFDGGNFRSATWCWPEAERWFVYAEIPGRFFVGQPRSLGEQARAISFGRYDYSRKRVRPIISSTSNHAAPDFHRRHEWAVLNFENR